MGEIKIRDESRKREGGKGKRGVGAKRGINSVLREKGETRGGMDELDFQSCWNRCRHPTFPFIIAPSILPLFSPFYFF